MDPHDQNQDSTDPGEKAWTYKDVGEARYVLTRHTDNEPDHISIMCRPNVSCRLSRMVSVAGRVLLLLV